MDFVKSVVKQKKKPELREHKIQSKFVGGLDSALKPGVHCYAIPNGGFRLKGEAGRLKAEGVKGGISDLVFIAPEWKTYWLEMKDGKGSLSDKQMGFSAICKRNGHPWAVARSKDEAMEILRGWGLLRTGY